MKSHRFPKALLLSVLALSLLSSSPGFAQDLVKAKDGSGVYGYQDTPRLPWCNWLVHDPDRPAPQRVDPGKAGPPAAAPSDAKVLFDGTGMNAWEASDWKIESGCLVSGNGMLKSKERFGNAQIHIEWMTPTNFDGPWYNRGNNGVLLMGLYEIQIFDSYNEKIYPDGQAAAIYGQTPPLVNVTRPPGEWQTFDIVFTAPVFKDNTLVQPARVTLLHNGVLVHRDEPIHGETLHRALPDYKSRASNGPLAFGGHGCPVRFRNIWVRPL
ncbi:MAG TPA: DUF1080 domain-containing protein [Verrucomicrobiota bacterium]|nr:DUF1080 domain-containing protein [Verrucomicrobiota bacterium]HNU51345.1 DUF1080 domain-containing protein [Verrucomicrobiota bacterium]